MTDDDKLMFRLMIIAVGLVGIMASLLLHQASNAVISLLASLLALQMIGEIPDDY